MPRTSTKENTKTQLLEAGMEVMLEKGYNHTGINEVLEKVGVPKGSFYYYFDSKHEFGLAIIDHFDSIYTERLKRILDNESKPPIERLRQYIAEGMADMEAKACKKGCLIGKLSQEMSEQCDVFRAKLEQVMRKWRDRFANCIKEGQKSGQISSKYDATELAEFFLSGWEGSVLRAKTVQSTEPSQVFLKVMFEQVLKDSK